jgi:hypothetical protein
MPLGAFFFCFLCFLLFSFSLTHVSFFLMQAVHTFLSRGNPTEVLKWWGRLNSTTRFFVEAASFKHFVETQPIERAKKSILCALAERWWDTTHTFHIASVEMTITPYGVYRLTGLRVDGIVPTFSAFPAGVLSDREYLGVSLGRLLLTSLPSCVHLQRLLRPLLRRQPGWLGLFYCT